MKFLELAELFEKLESTSSRNEMTALLAGFITRNRSESEQLAMAAYLFMGRVAPLFVPAEFNYSEKSMLNVMVGIATQLGGEVDITKLRSELGDAGLVAFQLSEKLDGSGKAEGYQVSDLYEQLWKIINTSGSGSIATKSNIAGEILVRLTPVEAKFFARIVSGKMRLGVSVKTFLDAISVALKGDKGMRERLDRCYGVDPDIGWLLYNMLTHGEGGVDGELVVGIPLHSRLVERVKDFEEVFTRLGEEIIFQPKFDGLRCQAHVGVKYVESTMGERVWIEPMKMHSSTAGEGGALGLFAADQSAGDSGVELFSRNLERMTSMFPDVVAELSKHIDEGTVLDCEVIGWDADTRSFLPFQETMSRKRKHGIDAATLDIPVKLFVFDILAYKGKSLLDKDTEERLEILDKLLSKVPAESLIAKTDTRVIKSREELDSFFVQSVEEGLEGLIAKSKKGGYQPGVRNFEWIKLKKSMDKELVDTIDVVIMGYYFGSGKKTQFGMGALLGGIYNPESGEIESVTKIGTGITDGQWREIAMRLKEIEVKDRPKQYSVARELEPDVWVAPEVVSTVEADEITKSKLHIAGKGELGYGLALRFPRLVEFDRDKTVEQATSTSEFVKLWGK